MDSFQNQITAITQKLDALNRLTEQLSDKINNLISETQLSNEQPQNAPLDSFTESLRSRSEQLNRFEGTMGHKDILIDNDYPSSDGHTGERALTPEVQIQRLTAQLTAAYGRIAALEEQLLARRIAQ
jgi:dynactin complex subunit